MFSIAELVTITGGRTDSELDGEVSGISTDSRTIQPGELFVPLVGEQFDGHRFLAAMPEKGVYTALAAEQWLRDNQAPEIGVIAVPDTLQALGDLARSYRLRYGIPLVGITGSNGKTTTKEMLAAILDQLGPGLKTAGNLNNLIGLPQMLFRLSGEHGWGVLEMGMSEPGEIDRLAEIAVPAVGVVLNAFPAHLESMGSVENVAKAKGELLLRLPPDGRAIVNADDPLIAALPVADGVRRITFGLDCDADVRGAGITPQGVIGQRFLLQLDGNDYPVMLHAFGKHSIYNALAAAAAASALGIPAELIVSGLQSFRPYDKRFNLQTVGGINLIDDTYNANPASVSAALTTLGEIKGTARAFVALGDMLELGGNEAELHHSIGVQAARIAEQLYLYGPLGTKTAAGARDGGMPPYHIICGLSHAEIAADLCRICQPGDFVLLKGSRGMKMETVAAEMKRIMSSSEKE